MKTYRTGTLPPDLKSFSQANRNEDLKEALHTIVSLILIAAMIFLFMFAAAVPPEPQVYPMGREEVRG
jgi:hypothetical protein